MNEIVITNEYIQEELHSNYENKHINEVQNIISTTKNSYKGARDLIIKSKKYTNEEKIIFLDILDIFSTVNKKQKIPTTNYDRKVYSLFFINEFFDFLNDPENSFSLREMKLLMAIYKLIAQANGRSNCLLTCTNSKLSKTSGIDMTNVGKIVKSLGKKGILKIDEDGGIYINCKYFFMGNSMKYDTYKTQYENM